MVDERSATLLLYDENHLKYNMIKSVYTAEESTCIIKQLSKLTYISLDETKVFVSGKWHKTPRRQLAVGDEGLSYGFSGSKIKTVSWATYPFLEYMRDYIHNVMLLSNIIPVDSPKMNYVLINLYRDGSDYIGYHSDDEKDMYKVANEQFIVSLSFGAARDFIFALKSNHSIKKKILLESGDLLIMRGDTNKYWKHTLPKRLKVKEPRWNLTFRYMS